MNNYGENKMINIYIINEFHLYIIYKTKKQCYESLVCKKIPRKKNVQKKLLISLPSKTKSSNRIMNMKSIFFNIQIPI